MGWNILNYIAGAACIIGPVALVVWYFQAAKAKVKKLNDKTK